MFSLETKISESIFYGSVFLALEQNFFTAKELLIWLSNYNLEVTIKTKIAYKAVCFHLELTEQYLVDGYHFLFRKPIYHDIAVAYGLDIYMPDRIDDLNLSEPLFFHLHPLISFSINMSKFIVFGESRTDYLLDNLTLCYLARNDPYFRNLTADDYNRHFLNADWITKLRFNNNLIELLIKRIQELQILAPVYYSSIANKLYYQVARKIYKLNLLTKLNYEQIKLFDSYFPNIIDQHVFIFKDLAFKLSFLSNDVAGYLLGFPIHKMIPNEKQIRIALNELDSLGIDEYCNKLKSIRIKVKKKGNYANEADVLMEQIDEYSPYDIIKFQAGEHLYRFSRAEFTNILQTKKNPWTNEDLHPTILSSMHARNLAAQEIKLPDCLILKDLLSNGVFEKDFSMEVRAMEVLEEARQFDVDIIIFEGASDSEEEEDVSEEEIEE